MSVKSGAVKSGAPKAGPFKAGTVAADTVAAGAEPAGSSDLSQGSFQTPGMPGSPVYNALTFQTWSTVQRRVFLWLGPVGALACIIALGTQWGDVDPLDRYALPILAAVILSMTAALALNLLSVTVTTRTTFLANAVYLLLGLNHQFWQFVPTHQMLSESSYWFGVLYATAFLAFRAERAIQVCAAIFTSAVLICGVRLWILGASGQLSITGRTVASVGQFLLSSGVLVLLQYAVGKLRQQLDQVRTAAYLDVLTGLPNRRFAQHQLDALVHSERGFSLVMIDIDHFKRVNDTYGHQAGDMVLRETGRVIGKHLSGRQFMARWGGEEFVLVLPGLHKHGAKTLSETARQELYQHVFDQVGGLTASFGVAEWADGDTPEAVMSRADAAMYAAKRQGRNGVRVAMEDGRLTRLDLPVATPPETEFPVRAALATPSAQAQAPAPGSSQEGVILGDLIRTPND